VKDWMLIGISVWVFHSAVSALNVSGYLLAFLGVCWYNYQKLQAVKEASKSTIAKPDEAPLIPVQRWQPPDPKS